MDGRSVERLNRGLVAVPVAAATGCGVYLGWRLLAGDPPGLGFQLYRDDRLVHTAGPADATGWHDPDGQAASRYSLQAAVGGTPLGPAETATVWPHPYWPIPLDRPAGGVTPDGVAFVYHANDAGVGDLDGDGAYEIVLKWDPSNAHDNAHAGYTGNVLLDAYRLDGTRLWRIDLGRNIRAGAHYTQFMVHDLDGDGLAEVACKTADGTTDGAGAVIGDPAADHRNPQGYVLDGPEFLTVFAGPTGRALATVPYIPPRGRVADWGDAYGNRVDRFLAAVAHLEPDRPHLIMGRGYYTRLVVATFRWDGRELRHAWTFDSDTPGNAAYAGQGNHNLAVADVDGDGCDEIIYGACAIDHDGTGLYATGLGHGDAMAIGDLDPARPGLEVFCVHEHPGPSGIEMHDAGTGEILWGLPTTRDTGRGTAAEIAPGRPGAQCWAGGTVYDCRGEPLGVPAPSSTNFTIWWDGDTLRELLDGTRIDRWDPATGRTVNLLTATGCASNNGTKATPCLQADILGDWREEVVWRADDDSELRIYTTTIPTGYRLPTLMHDPVYRLAVAWQNTAYNQPPQLGFSLRERLRPTPEDPATP